jgi:hypothetical protein
MALCPEGKACLVTHEPVGTSPKLIGDIVSLIIGAYDILKEKILYGPAEDYDVSVFYEKGSGRIIKVTFTHKLPKPSEPLYLSLGINPQAESQLYPPDELNYLYILCVL